jgi:glycosyltransferase involved in cell wall biosynthesis
MTSVLYVLKRFPRLSETFVLHELLRLQESGLQLGVDSLRVPEDQPRHPELASFIAPVRVLERDTVEQQAMQVASRARIEGFTHLHAHFATGAADVAIAAGRLAGIPVTVTAHAKDIYHREYAPGLADRLARASAVVTVTEYNAEHLRNVLPTVPVHIVRNPIPTWPDRRRTIDGPILTVARLVPKKGMRTLLEALAVTSKRGGVELEIVGDGPLRPQLEELAAELGISERVMFHGALAGPDVDAAYARASVFALPCRVDEDDDRDGLPTVLGEAMARGLPVISTDLVGIPELVHHEETGLLVPPDDVDALAAALVRLGEDVDLADSLARAGRDFAADLLDPKRSTDDLLRVFGSTRS